MDQSPVIERLGQRNRLSSSQPACYNAAMSSHSQHAGSFIKPCPCSPQTVACGYHNINLHTGCPFECSYCILQLYLPSKRPHHFTNLDDAARELKALSATTPHLRLGTGELADSLADPHSDRLVPYLYSLMSDLPQVLLELKTKSDRIDAILVRRPQRNVVIAWSLNPQAIIEREERMTASLDRRLQAIKSLADQGHRVAIHFDPLILTPDWKDLYRDLVEQIFSILPIGQLAWWSLGALRFPAPLRFHIFRHSASRLFDGELIKGYDDKYRYLRPLREELFLTLRDWIVSRLGSTTPLYLCMEDEAMWRTVFPEHEPSPDAINRRLHQWDLLSAPTARSESL